LVVIIAAEAARLAGIIFLLQSMFLALGVSGGSAFDFHCRGVSLAALSTAVAGLTVDEAALGIDKFGTSSRDGFEVVANALLRVAGSEKSGESGGAESKLHFLW
jgi:hypothetical protein